MAIAGITLEVLLAHVSLAGRGVCVMSISTIATQHRVTMKEAARTMTVVIRADVPRAGAVLSVLTMSMNVLKTTAAAAAAAAAADV